MAGTHRKIKWLKQQAHRLLRENKQEEAFRFITDALSVDMDDPEALYMAGCYFRQRGHSGIAAQMFRRTVAIDPKHPNPWMHFGATLHDMHLYEEAIEVFKICKGMVPDEPTVYANLAASHQQMGEFPEAFSYAHEALKRKSSHRQALTVKAMAALGLERWKEGFEGYKYMYGGQVTIRVYCQPEEPEWDGTSGKVVVIQSDQGMGDEIRFASMIPEMVKDCKEVIIDCHPKLQNVFKRSFPEAFVYGTKKLKEGVTWIDHHQIEARTHISGIGRFYRTKDKDFPRKPYLQVDPVRQEKWRENLKKLPRPLVGIAWEGGTIATGKEWRSTLLEQWRGLADHAGTLIDLSYHDSEAECKAFGNIFRPDVDHGDYEDTLALLAELDLVICVPTTVMHACGAIGKQAWVLVPKWTPWEFGRFREDMIWYPQDSVRLFRSKDMDLTATIDEITKAYKQYVADFHRDRPEATVGVYRPAKLHYSARVSSGPDYAADLAAIATKTERAHGVHF